jgi:hypothetical protein
VHTRKADREIRHDLEQRSGPRERGDVGMRVRAREGITEDASVREQWTTVNPKALGRVGGE